MLDSFHEFHTLDHGTFQYDVLPWQPRYAQCTSCSIFTPGLHTSLASHTLRRERKVWSRCNRQVVATTKLDVTNQIRTLRRLHPLSGVQLRHNMFSGCQHLITCSLASHTLCTPLPPFLPPYPSQRQGQASYIYKFKELIVWA